MYNTPLKDFTWEIIEPIAIVSKINKTMEIQLNLMSFNGKPPRYDLRYWSIKSQKNGYKPNRMLKGLSFSKLELSQLREILNSMDLSDVGELKGE